MILYNALNNVITTHAFKGLQCDVKNFLSNFPSINNDSLGTIELVNPFHTTDLSLQPLMTVFSLYTS